MWLCRKAARRLGFLIDNYFVVNFEMFILKTFHLSQNFPSPLLSSTKGTSITITTRHTSPDLCADRWFTELLPRKPLVQFSNVSAISWVSMAGLSLIRDRNHDICLSVSVYSVHLDPWQSCLQFCFKWKVAAEAVPKWRKNLCFHNLQFNLIEFGTIEWDLCGVTPASWKCLQVVSVCNLINCSSIVSFFPLFFCLNELSWKSSMDNVQPLFSFLKNYWFVAEIAQLNIWSYALLFGSENVGNDGRNKINCGKCRPEFGC